MDDVIGRFVRFVANGAAVMANACQRFVNEKSAADGRRTSNMIKNIYTNLNRCGHSLHSLCIVVRHESVRKTFITFIQAIDCRQIESSGATVLCLWADGDGRKSNITDWLQFAVNRDDDWIGARFFIHFENGPAAQTDAQTECHDPPGPVKRTAKRKLMNLR